MSKLDVVNALEKIRGFFKSHDRLPSLSEIAGMCGYASRNAAVYLVDKLIESGFMTKDAKGHLITTSIFHERIKLLGTVSAGFPVAEEEDLRNTVSLDTFLIDNISATYMLQVQGDSMINAGIQPGDYVLVEKGRTLKAGDIVVAQVDKEWTMKYFRKKNGKICLEAANSNYNDIYPQTELTIAGVVVSCCRRYG
jgi:SOS regulatory protein LexA